tara:strand:- start:13 stop:261 length:249 start_codon:yes stop_codon:yes gene_type:complete
MALAKTRALNKIEIVGSFKHIQARYEIKVTDGEEAVAKSYERESYAPNESIASLPAELQPYATTAWTNDVVKSYNEYIEQEK